MKDLKIELYKRNPYAELVEGFDKALLGITNSHNTEFVAVYDKNKMINMIMKKESIIKKKALEYFVVNILRSTISHNPHYPIFVELFADVSPVEIARYRIKNENL